MLKRSLDENSMSWSEWSYWWSFLGPMSFSKPDWQLLNTHKSCIHKKINSGPGKTLDTFNDSYRRLSSSHPKQNKMLQTTAWIKTGCPKETLGPCQSWHDTSVCTYDASLSCPLSINTLLSSGQTCLNLAEYWQDDIVNDLDAEKPLPFAWPFLLHQEWTVIRNLLLLKFGSDQTHICVR